MQPQRLAKHWDTCTRMCLSAASTLPTDVLRGIGHQYQAARHPKLPILQVISVTTIILASHAAIIWPAHHPGPYGSVSTYGTGCAIQAGLTVTTTRQP